MQLSPQIWDVMSSLATRAVQDLIEHTATHLCQEPMGRPDWPDIQTGELRDGLNSVVFLQLAARDVGSAEPNQHITNLFQQSVKYIAPALIAAAEKVGFPAGLAVTLNDDRSFHIADTPMRLVIASRRV